MREARPAMTARHPTRALGIRRAGSGRRVRLVFGGGAGAPRRLPCATRRLKEGAMMTMHANRLSSDPLYSLLSTKVGASARAQVGPGPND